MRRGHNPGSAIWPRALNTLHRKPCNEPARGCLTTAFQSRSRTFEAFLTVIEHGQKDRGNGRFHLPRHLHGEGAGELQSL
jgi:hypothetical protein